MHRHNEPETAGTTPIVRNMRGDRAFDIQSGRIVCRETPFLQRVLILAVAAGVLGCAAMGNAGAAPVLPKPSTAAHAAAKPAAPAFHFQHRSIWAVKWAAQHPAEEAAYQRTLMSRYVHRPAARAWRRWARRPAGAHAWMPGGRHRTAHWIAGISPASIHIPPSMTPRGVRVAFSAPAPAHIAILPNVDDVPVVTAQPIGGAPAKAAPSTRTRVAQSDDSQVAGASPYDNGGANVSLDFVAADINDVIKSLAMQTHTNIVSGADVKGNVTVTLTKVTLDEALDMITKLSGFGYAKVGRTYVVGTPASIQSLTTSGTGAVAPVTAVLTLSYSDIVQMQTSIKDRYPNVKVTRGSTVGNVSAGGVLIVTGTDEDIAGVKALVDASETALAHGIAVDRTELYHIKYSSPIDLMAMLSRLVPSLVVTPAPTPGFSLSAPTTADSGTSSGASGGGGAGSAPGGSSTSTSSNGNSTTSTSTVAVKPGVDRLLLTGSDNDINRALDILRQVDVRPAQINYDAKITEINLDKTRDLGFNWSASGPVTFNSTIADETSPTTSGAGSFKVAHDIATVNVNAIFQDADTKVLADPNIAAVDGQQAAVFIGDTVNYVSSITQASTGESVTTSSVNVGIKLYVAGKVSDDGYVTVNIHPEVSTISSWLNVPGGGQLPDIATREATTTVRVKDGDYIAIGGLINTQDVVQINKIPGLGDLPFFGALFRDTQRSKSRDEVVIFVKVSIDKDAS